MTVDVPALLIVLPAPTVRDADIVVAEELVENVLENLPEAIRLPEVLPKKGSLKNTKLQKQNPASRQKFVLIR